MSVRLIVDSPADEASERGSARERAVLLTAGTSIVGKVIAGASTLISVRLALSYLGAERYGVWATINSTLAVMTFSDLGISNGILNRLAASSASNDVAAQRRYVSSAVVALGLAALVLAAVCSAVAAFVDWGSTLNVVGAVARQEAGPAVFAGLLCYLLLGPINIVQRIPLAYQEGHRANIWQASGSVLAVALLWVAIRMQAGLPGLLASFWASSAVASAAAWFVEVWHRRPSIRPSLSSVSRLAMGELLGPGLLFLVIQVSIAFMFASDNIVIARVLGASVVPEYAVPARLFQLVSVLAGFFFLPLWPAYAEAAARNDGAWVGRTVRRSTALSALVSIAMCGGLVVLGRTILSLWVDDAVTTRATYLAYMGLATVFQVLASCLSVLLYATNRIRAVAALSVLTAAVTLGLKVLMTQHYGIAGLLIAVCVGAGPLYLLPVALLTRLEMKRIDGSH